MPDENGSETETVEEGQEQEQQEHLVYRALLFQRQYS